MATDVKRPPVDRVAMYALLGLAAAVGVAVLFAYLSRPPQMGASEEAFQTVDALYTAVRSRDAARVGQCERRLKGYREAGKLPAAAGDALDAIVAQARDGAWEAAAAKLYDFMLAQRREGVSDPPREKKKAKK